MAKVTWGGAELESALSDYEADEQQYESYDGERPPKGLYRWNIRMEKTISSGGFNQLIVHLTLDPHNSRTNQYKGYYCRDYIIVKEDGSTAFRVRPLLDAMGVTAKQFRQQTLSNPTDRTTNNDQKIEEVVKIGPVKIEGLQLMARIAPDKKKPEYERVFWVGGADDADEAQEPGDSDAGDTDDDSEPPF
jgi:hypothetical protein